jgi:hypothetical protein
MPVSETAPSSAEASGGPAKQCLFEKTLFIVPHKRRWTIPVLQRLSLYASFLLTPDTATHR